MHQNYQSKHWLVSFGPVKSKLSTLVKLTIASGLAHTALSLLMIHADDSN